jgi:hypothetical protein
MFKQRVGLATESRYIDGNFKPLQVIDAMSRQRAGALFTGDDSAGAPSSGRNP